MKPVIGIIHLSDIQFGPKHRFVEPDKNKSDYFDEFLEKTCTDILLMSKDNDIPLDLLVHSGDLAETGSPKELQRGFQFLDKISEQLKIPRQNVIVVPGNHDINWTLCKHARERANLEGRIFNPPYTEKFEYFERELGKFVGTRTTVQGSYIDVRAHTDLGLITIMLNSCYDESELEQDHFGSVGPNQLFEAMNRVKELDPNNDFIRLVILHHGLEISSSPEDALREPEKLINACQEYGCRIILHGHTHTPRAYVKGAPHKPLVYILSSGSAGLEQHTLPDIPNHYSLIKFTNRNLSRYHRQFSSRLIDTKTGYGKWATDSTEFDNGIEIIEFDKPLDEVQIDSTKDSLLKNVSELIRKCRYETSKEIDRVAKRKYIESLYIDREIQSVISSHLWNDETLANRLSHIQNDNYKIVTYGRKEEQNLKNQLANRKKNTKTELNTNFITEKEIREKLNKTKLLVEKALNNDERLSVILSEAMPCSGKHLQSLKMIDQSYEEIRKDLDISKIEIDFALYETLRTASRSSTIIIDRAGGGKTNLLCHLALKNSQLEPTLFVGGRIQITGEDSLLIQIAERMGCSKGQDANEYLKRMDYLLDHERCHATIFIDGLNENRDIEKLNKAMVYFFKCITSTRFRVIATCRDIYWAFFEQQPWVESSNIIRGNLCEFSKAEQAIALGKYLDFFNIEVDLGPLALERCRHPLLLRFFCEAYTKKNERVNLGRVSEIRLKRLFDDYWIAKIQNMSSGMLDDSPRQAEEYVYQLVSYMFKMGIASLTTDQVPIVTGDNDLRTEKSLYLGLLDEDIVIEELPTEDTGTRRVVFVYEEFMEYAIARYFDIEQNKYTKKEIDEFFSLLQNKVASFVNVLGITEYLCAFHLEHNRIELAFPLLVNMARTGGKWTKILANVFIKYEKAASMIENVASSRFSYLLERFSPNDKSVDLNGIHTLLDALGTANRELTAELCVLLGFNVLLPITISSSDIIERNLLAFDETKIGSSKPLIEADQKRARKLISVIGKLILKHDINTIRNPYWKGWANRREYLGPEDRRELIRTLANIIRSSPRRQIILTYACNGLFDQDVEVRRACALVSKDLRSDLASTIRKTVMTIEKDLETKRLLSDRFTGKI